MYKLTSEMQLKPVDINTDDPTQFTDGAIVISTDGIIYRAEANSFTSLLDPSNISNFSDYYTRTEVDNLLVPINVINTQQSSDVTNLQSQLGNASPELNDVTQTANAAYTLAGSSITAIGILEDAVTANIANIDTNTQNISILQTSVSDHTTSISSIEDKMGSRATWQKYEDGHQLDAPPLQPDIKGVSNLLAWKYCSDNTGNWLSKGYTYDHHFAYLNIGSYQTAGAREVIYFPNDLLSTDIQDGKKPGFKCTVYNVTDGAAIKLWNTNDATAPRFRLLDDPTENPEDLIIMGPGETWEISYCVGQATQEIWNGSVFIEVPFWLVHRIR